MKKTLLITYFFPPAIGGIENYYLNLCRGLAPAEITVLAQSAEGAVEFDRNEKYKIERAEFFAGKLAPTWLPLKKIIKEIITKEGIEQIVFGHFHPFNILGNGFGLPYFIFCHGADIRGIKRSFWQKFIFKKVYPACGKIISNSDFLAGEIEKLVGDRSRATVIYPGVNFELLNAPVADLAEKKRLLGIAENDIVMLSLGRLVKAKNFDAMVALMPSLIELIPNLKYLIAGDGPEMPVLKNLIRQLDLENKVKLVGAVKNTEADKSVFYQMAHLYLGVSSEPEGFGISYLEAQACGLPVVASKLGGSAEAIKDGLTGILVAPNNPDEITKAIYQILSNQELWQKMSAAGKENVRENFLWPKQIETIKRLVFNR